MDMNAPRTRVVRRPARVLLIDKPLGMTSNQALQKAKWLLRAEKAGHTGIARSAGQRGALPLCFGAATKFSQLQLEAAKTYEAIALLGTTTTTGDAEGEVLQQCAVEPSQITPSAWPQCSSSSPARSCRYRRCTARSSVTARHCMNTPAPGSTSNAHRVLSRSMR